jgi:hypothetical protein
MEYYDEKPGLNPRITGYSILITAFIVLAAIKLIGQYDWSWKWVTLPLWIVPLVYLGLVIWVILLAILRIIKQAFSARE